LDAAEILARREEFEPLRNGKQGLVVVRMSLWNDWLINVNVSRKKIANHCKYACYAIRLR